jgi:hypothetical protein
MADLVAFAATGGLPVRLNLPVPLQRPYAADPGTLTEWFLEAKTANLGRDTALAVLAAMNDKYANLVDPSSLKSESTPCSGSWQRTSWSLKDWNPS